MIKMPRKKKRRIMSIDELYKFCLKNNFAHFDSNEFGKELMVRMNGNFAKTSKDEDKHRESLTPFVSRAFHDHVNLNKSEISEESFNENVPSANFRPILAHITTNSDDELDFGSHDYYVTTDKDGNDKVVYEEQPIGVIDGTKTTVEYDEDAGVNRAVLHGYLYDEYCQDAIEILNRRGTVDCSVELCIRELSFNNENKTLLLDDFYVSGLTLLSKDVSPGMAGSNFKIEDFTVGTEPLSFDKDAKLIELLEDLNKTISNFNKEQNSKEGGDKENMNKFEELCQKYGKSADDITFDYENMTDEELETKFSEMFDGEGDAAGNDAAVNNDGQTAGGSSTEVTDTNAEGSSGTGSTDENTSTDPNPDETTDDNTEGTTSEDPDDFPKKQTMQRTFEVSHDDIRYALYTLLQPYEEADNAWYWIVDVYDSYFVYEGSGKYYGQKYSVEDDNVAFDDERYELFAEFLTASEKAALSDMRANYTTLKEFKENAEKNELHEQREKILADQKFESVAKTDAFKELVRNMDNYSLEDLEKEAKIVFADNVELISNSDANSGVKIFANVNKNSKPKKRYGNLFD